MPAYLGTLGRLAPIKCAAQPVTREDRYSYETTLEGRVKAQKAGVSRRSWNVSLGLAAPAQIASLWAFDDGEWGIGPFLWVTPEAQVTNLLLPEVASCGPEAVGIAQMSVAGPMALEGGEWAGRSLVTTDPGGVLWVGSSTQVPVLPGRPVTASAYVLGAGAKVSLNWYGAGGVLLPGTVVSSGSGVASGARRLHATGVPPAGAVSCALSSTRALQLTRPAITWTPTPVPYGPGAGCVSAVIDGLEREPRLLTDKHYRASASFIVREVG